MKTLGNFRSKQWGPVTVNQATYRAEDGPTAILLDGADGQSLTKLSVNMYRPESSHDSRDLPDDCFYVKTWEENETLAPEAFASGLFIARPDLPQARSGHVTAPVWQVKPTGAAS